MPLVAALQHQGAALGARTTKSLQLGTPPPRRSRAVRAAGERCRKTAQRAHARRLSTDASAPWHSREAQPRAGVQPGPPQTYANEGAKLRRRPWRKRFTEEDLAYVNAQLSDATLLRLALTWSFHGHLVALRARVLPPAPGAAGQ